MIPSCHGETLVGVFNAWVSLVQKMKHSVPEELILAEIVCSTFGNQEIALIYASRVTLSFNFIQQNHKELRKENLIKAKNDLILFSFELIEILSSMPMTLGKRVSYKQFDKERKKHLLKNLPCINKLSI